MTTLEFILVFINAVIIPTAIFYFRSFLKSYIDAKAKNLATKEDIGAITRVTEEVKHDIQKASLIEQKRWDLKKETYIGLIDALRDFSTCNKRILESYDPNVEDEFKQKRKEFYQQQKELSYRLSDDLSKFTTYGSLFISEEVLKTLDHVGLSLQKGQDIEDPYAYTKFLIDTSEKLYGQILNAAKKDLFQEENA